MNEMQCRELVGAYAVGALDPPDAAVLADHLLTCGRCRQLLAEAEQIAAMLSVVPPEAFIDEPADPNDLVLRRALHEIRAEAAGPRPTAPPQQAAPVASVSGWTARSHRRRPRASSARKQRRTFAIVGAAAAVVLVVGGAVIAGTQLTGDDSGKGNPSPIAEGGTGGPRSVDPGTASEKLLSGSSDGLSVQVTATASDSGGVKLDARLIGIKPGQTCTITVRSTSGTRTVVKSWEIQSTNVTDGNQTTTNVPNTVDTVNIGNLDAVQFAIAGGPTVTATAG